MTFIKKLAKYINSRVRERGDVLYHHSEDKITIKGYVNASLYTSQVSGENVEVSYSLPDRKLLTFSTRITEGFIDRKSYDKYGGLYYIYEPMSDELAKEILNAY